MFKTSLQSLAILYREEHTSTTLKRSTNIENCAPDGYFRIIHSVALATKDGNSKTIAEIRKNYNDSLKGSKGIMENLGKLTAAPFPIIESAKKQGIQSKEYVNSPLYDISTGNTVEERYASVNMSALGKLLTRHYLNTSIRDIEYYRSIVPFSLLRKSYPFGLGYKDESYPMNPAELFSIMVEMMKINSPMVPASVLEKHFRGFDFGEAYNIYTTKDALVELYTSGVSSFITIPKVTIDRKRKEIIFDAPPLNSTSRKLRDYFVSCYVNPVKTFNTFDFDVEVKLVGKKIILQITNFYGTDEEIMTELINNPKITVKITTSNVTIRYNKEDKTASSEDLMLANPIEPIKLTDYEPFKSMAPEKLAKLTESEINRLAEKAGINRNQRTTEEEYFDIVFGANKSVLSEDAEDASGNPYPYTIDKSPVFEVLWECIQGERELQKKGIRRKLAEYREQLKYDLLYEKASRPEVAKVIYKLQPQSQADRIESLLAVTQPGSELLKEGFARWEAEEIYKLRGNNFLPRIFLRHQFEHEYLNTLELIKALEDKLNNNALIDADIIDDLQSFISNPKYQRKSQVKFLKEESITKLPAPTPNSYWDSLDVPVAIYYDTEKMIRSYGVNKYVNQLNPIGEIQTTNDSWIGVLQQNGKSTKVISIKANQISRQMASVLPNDFRGFIPIQAGEELMLYTNQGRYYAYTNIVPIDLELNDGEFVIGWVPTRYKYFDLYCENGIQTFDKTFINPYKTKMNIFGPNLGIVYDILGKDENDNRARVIGNKHTSFVSDRKMYKSFQAKPVPAMFYEYPAFAPHVALYVNDLYLEKWEWLGIAFDDDYRPNKQVYINEYMPKAPYTDNISEEVISRFNMIGRNILSGSDTEYNYKALLYRSTPSYDNFDPSDPKLKAVLDPRNIQ